jgi:hypothetical protein
VRLIPGRHRQVVQADSAVSQGDSAALEVNYVLGTPPQGRLLVLAVGIAAYADEKLKLCYAAKDAQAVADRLKEKARPKPFQDVAVRVLTDNQATRAGVLKELEALQKQMKPEDSAIVFYSGHGERDDKGGLYLLPVDVDLKKLKETAVSGEDLKMALVNLPGLVLLVLDLPFRGAGIGEAVRQQRFRRDRPGIGAGRERRHRDVLLDGAAGVGGRQRAPPGDVHAGAAGRAGGQGVEGAGRRGLPAPPGQLRPRPGAATDQGSADADDRQAGQPAAVPAEQTVTG